MVTYPVTGLRRMMGLAAVIALSTEGCFPTEHHQENSQSKEPSIAWEQPIPHGFPSVFPQSGVAIHKRNHMPGIVFVKKSHIFQQY
ncbi:MAG: hypothetical protein O6947_04695 [Acidobacteria bacterium]|nr:hypothetical protein [Acidobacteriota bacterium]